jgi:hypothetical protein
MKFYDTDEDNVDRTPQELEAALMEHRAATLRKWEARREAAAQARQAAPPTDAEAALQALRRRKHDELAAECERVRTTGEQGQQTVSTPGAFARQRFEPIRRDTPMLRRRR